MEDEGKWTTEEEEATHVVANLILVLPLVPVDLERGDLGSLLELVPVLSLLFALQHHRHVASTNLPLALLGIDLPTELSEV